jgi:Reverse transcriptase (RNA-dependent DNA polymerase)
MSWSVKGLLEVKTQDDNKLVYCKFIALLSMLDLSAAFDTVDLQILLRSLYLSFRINLLDWLMSYLSGRNQSIRHCGNASSNTVLTCGVPQGSVLGPILLALYTGDAISIIENISLLPHSYADDTKIHGFCQPIVKSIGYLRKDILDCIDAEFPQDRVLVMCLFSPTKYSRPFTLPNRH